MFILRTSKTHGWDKHPQMIKISSKPISQTSFKNKEKQNSQCPYKLLRSYLWVRGPSTSPTETFFIFSDRLPVTPKNMRTALKCCLKQASFNEKLYDTHSLRSGRAVDMYKNLKLSVESIKKLGRWSSNAVFKYLKC